MNTNELIESLAGGLKPVAPLWRPGRRAAVWALGATAYLGAVVAAMIAGSVNDASADTSFWVSQMAAVVTGLLASYAAFASVVPGLPKHSSVWPLLAALIWLGTLVTTPPWDMDWATVSAASHEWLCVGFILVGGLPLLLAIAVMLRRGAPLKPATTAALSALAVGALANVGACVSLPHANSEITFAWHGGVVLALVAVAALIGRLVFTWRTAGLPSIVEPVSRGDRG
jgi:hypothetical protein